MLSRAFVLGLVLLALVLLVLLVPLLRDPAGARSRVLALLQAPGAKAGAARSGPLLPPLLVLRHRST